MKKINYKLRKSLEIYETCQRLKLRTGVPVAVSSCSAAAHMYMWTLWTFLDVTFTDNCQVIQELWMVDALDWN